MSAFKKSVLAIGVGTALSAAMIPNAHAIGFNWGDIEGSFNSTFSVGSSWRVEGRDFNNQVGKVNNPNNGLDWRGYSALTDTRYTSNELFAMNGSYSSNGDLANLAWSKGDAFSQVVKGLHELDLRYENYGIFVRGMYFKDFALDGDLDYNYELAIGENDARGIDVCRDKEASDLFCSDIRLLDAYFTADWDFGEVPVSFRVGQQVISWGESALISHGIATTNAVDLGRLRSPGAELKEAFIPQGMAWVSAGLTENLAVEAYYQYEWQGTVVPVGGTYFASNDFVSHGGQYNAIQLGFNGNPDIDGDFLISELEKVAAMNKSGAFSTEQMLNAMLAYPTKVALRTEDIEPEDGGQYGLKLSYFFDDTEVAIYHMNYHSRRPLISGQASDFTAPALLRDLAVLENNIGSIDHDVMNQLESFTKAKIVFPEDIKLYGLSWNTTLGDTSFAGEVSHRQDEALQIDDVELLFAAMPQQLANAGWKPELDGISQVKGATYPYPEGSTVEPGILANGFVLLDTTQAQFNLAHLFGPTLGADNLTVFAEVGGIWIHDMPDQDVLRLNGPNTGRSGGMEGMEAIINVVHNGPETNPFPTDFAWGYRVVAKTDHNNLFSGVNASAKVVFSHDVEGITPDPIFLFTEGAKSIGASVDFDYQNRWSASVGYNAFWGGTGSINTMSDKDFVSFNIKYSI
ncbi:DUF1302 domain-containing protein [Psychrobium sp. 1_MG-2023]|uniref:DUF1302 domain-containing protein n=1 Tax=Psychrobium sp. 1_MG-2023 TaxID=3062624 RepID=UPI000C326CC6|nr:DUF1302 domain-containing protein [Psychrobium sp. 1_MG-2023]MDP2560372.1 DUF1302 domain-containing protein [Psychrobium sp. 1_MG-2023]PKF55482.1 DUF1302 domain-containing protein [Alteromonadales bacterium alter-6D02]